jgi:uncharacterized protein involved in cysteine biosynthesis
MNYTLSTSTALTTMHVFVQYDGFLDRTSNNFPDIIETLTIMEAVISLGLLFLMKDLFTHITSLGHSPQSVSMS